MMLDSIDNGPLVYPTVEDNGQTRPKKYSELTEAQQLQDDCDVQARNIILHDLPSDVYVLVNHQEAAKDIWDRVKLLMKGAELSYQKRECRLYNLFNKFAYVQGETLYEYYLRFSQLINDIHTIRMTMQQVQVNTKFLNALLPEWSKFVTDVKLAKSLYTTNYDQLYAYLSQHKRHAKEQGEDPIDCINKAMTFLFVVASRGIATTSRGNYAAGQAKVVKCDNCLGERHMAKQCTQPKRPRSSAWFKEKLMLAEAQEAAFQTKDLDAYDSDCNDISSAKAVLMENLLRCDSDVLSESKPTLYDGSVIAKEHDVISVIVDEKTLILEEESRSKMLDKQNDLISVKQKINISPIDYSKLNKIKEDFVTPVRIEGASDFLSSVDILNVNKSCMDKCIKCLELEIELLKKKDLIEKDVYDKLLKSYSTLEKHCISLELTTQLNQEIFHKDNFRKNQNVPTFNQLCEINELKAQSQEKDTVIRKLKEKIKSLSGKDSVENVKKDIYEIETINIELEHSVDKKVKFVKPVTSSSNIPKQTDSLRTNDSNKPLLTSTGLNTTTSASGLKPLGNTKKNRISRPPSSNQKNKVGELPRKVKSSLNKMNSVSESISNAHVKHFVRNAKFESICAICNKCLFDANHDMCVIGYVNDVNMRYKSKSKRNKMKKVWKPTGKVFNEIGYSWKPTVLTPTQGIIVYISAYLHVFGALCYPTNDDEDLGPGPKLMTPRTISSGLVQTIPSSTPYVSPTKNDLEILFQPMFDEYLNPPPCVDL
uniref:Integrase, catalytic region, zinc finger, CCHC-type, peptidase aspartic, catalytic n=1 Tax=Tanacetum cinerariifolium TaxID=118510 RepID=A0A699H363_TANCI|nr:hypothetical protein [Tanacetum cinerariifolium]